MSFEPSGRFVVVGTTVGRFIVLDAVTGSHVVSVQLGTESLDALGFSPGSTTTAARTMITLVDPTSINTRSNQGTSDQYRLQVHDQQRSRGA